MENDIILSFTIGLGVILFIPCLLVAFWRSRPGLAMFISAVYIFLLLALPRTIIAYRALQKFDSVSAERVVFAFSPTITNGIIGLIIFMPLLHLFRWLIRKIFPDKAKVENQVFD